MSHHENDERGTANPAELPDGFGSVMDRVRNLDADEAVRLRELAERTVFGHETYALGREYLERGQYEQAARWLQTAAGHQVVGAQHDLDGLVLRQALPTTGDDAPDSVTDGCPVGLMPTTAALQANAVRKLWPELEAAVLRTASQQKADTVLTDAYRQGRAILSRARKQADQILLDARDTSDRLLADAQHQADGIRAEARQEAETLSATRWEAPAPEPHHLAHRDISAANVLFSDLSWTDPMLLVDFSGHQPDALLHWADLASDVAGVRDWQLKVIRAVDGQHRFGLSCELEAGWPADAYVARRAEQSAGRRERDIRMIRDVLWRGSPRDRSSHDALLCCLPIEKLLLDRSQGRGDEALTRDVAADAWARRFAHRWFEADQAGLDTDRIAEKLMRYSGTAASLAPPRRNFARRLVLVKLFGPASVRSTHSPGVPPDLNGTEYYLTGTDGTCKVVAVRRTSYHDLREDEERTDADGPLSATHEG